MWVFLTTSHTHVFIPMEDWKSWQLYSATLPMEMQSPQPCDLLGLIENGRSDIWGSQNLAFKILSTSMFIFLEPKTVPGRSWHTEEERAQGELRPPRARTACQLCEGSRLAHPSGHALRSGSSPHPAERSQPSPEQIAEWRATKLFKPRCLIYSKRYLK